VVVVRDMVHGVPFILVSMGMGFYALVADLLGGAGRQTSPKSTSQLLPPPKVEEKDIP
jgi:hypothetical protein